MFRSLSTLVFPELPDMFSFVWSPPGIQESWRWFRRAPFLLNCEQLSDAVVEYLGAHSACSDQRCVLRSCCIVALAHELLSYSVPFPSTSMPVRLVNFLYALFDLLHMYRRVQAPAMLARQPRSARTCAFPRFFSMHTPAHDQYC
jgi:hypothetical protein